MKWDWKEMVDGDQRKDKKIWKEEADTDRD